MNRRKTENAKRKVKTQSLKRLVLSFSFTLFALHFTFSCYAQPVSSSELINNAKQCDGKLVTYAGEVIGDIMARGNYAWLNVNDGNNAIGIWTDKNLIQEISCAGSYKSRGDWIEITGIFQRACPEHGGDLDIHAQSIRIIKQGRYLTERASLDKKNLVFILLGVLCLALILKLLDKVYRRKSKR